MKKTFAAILASLIMPVAWASESVSVVWPFGPVAATLPVRAMIDNHNSTGQSPKLSLEFKQGGGGLVATQHVLNSPEPIIYFAGSGIFLHNAFADKPAYDINRFVMLKHLCDLPLTVASKKYTSMHAVPADRRVTVATTGTGTSFTLVFRALQNQYPNMVEVPYKNSADGIKDLLGGHVDMIIATPGDTFPLQDNGLATNVGVSGTKRVRNIPTLKESLIPNTDKISVSYYFFLDRRFADRAGQFQKILDASINDNVKSIIDKNHCVISTVPNKDLPELMKNTENFVNQQVSAIKNSRR